MSVYSIDLPWYSLFFYKESYNGHFHFYLEPLGWITLAVIVAAILISLAIRR